MHRSLARPLSPVALLALVVVACSPAGPASTTPPPKVATKPPSAPVASPARWILHPTSSLSMRARFDLGNAGAIYAGDGGERWLDKRDGSAPIAAATLLPDAIVAIQSSGGATRFVADSGVVYTAKDPLGDAVASKAPPKKLRVVAAGKDAIVAVTIDGAMIRTTDGGATWSEVGVLPGTAGTLVRVAMLPTGRGLALYAPQKVAVTTDDGATWAPLATPGVGARKLLVDVNGDLLLEGVEDSAIFRDSPPRLEKIHRAPTQDFELSIPPDALHPMLAEAVDQGHALLLGDQYIEAVQDEDAGGETHWSFLVGAIGAAGAKTKVKALDGCEMVYLGGDLANLEIGCDRAPKGNAATSTTKKPKVEQRWHVELYKSNDVGKTLTPDGAVISADREDKHIFLGPDGTVVVDGGCKRAKSEWACEESPPVVRAPDGKEFAKVTGVINTRFSQVIFGDGGKAYALGTTTDSGRIALYVSTDGGKDFKRKWLPMIPRGDEPDDNYTAYALDSNAVFGSMTLDGATIRILAPDSSGTTWLSYSTSDDGATFDAHALPLQDVDNVAIAGKRAFAFDQSGKGYESSDAGATWSKVSAPRGGDVRVSLACSAYGCLIGDRATRVGWDGGGAPVDEKAAPVAEKKLVSASTIHCTLDDKETWKSLGNVAMPSASNADIGGGVRWVLARRDTKTGAIDAVVGTKGAKGVEVKTIPLFPAEPTGANAPEYASYASMQLEGVSAMRFAFKRDSMLAGKPKGAITAKQNVDVEVAWYVAATGKVSRATIKGVGPIDPYRDITDGMYSHYADQAHPQMLSIAIGGIHVRPLASQNDTNLWFASDAGKVEKLVWPDLPKADVHGRALTMSPDAARIGKRSVVFSTLTGGIQLWSTWGSEGGGAWEPHTWGLWPELVESGDLRVRYVDSGTTPGLAVLFSGYGDTPSAGWMALLDKATNDPESIVRLPTQSDLGDQPAACDKTNANAARVMLPYRIGTRHPVVIDGLSGPLATASAIVRVNDKGSCATALDAAAVKTPPEGPYEALLALDDLEHASLFHQASGEISVRPMKCGYTTEKPPSGISASIDGFGK